MNINDYKKYEPFWGKWYLSKELGRGAYGSVYEAETRDFGNMKSALKIVSIPSSPAEVDSYRAEHIGADEKSVSSYFYGIVEDFLKEISIMSQLKGKSNIVSIEDYEVREHTDSIGWNIFIRMEILSSLGNYFSNRPITEKDVVKIGIDICRALEECEKKNIIHRDIKQSNIFVSDSGEFKLGDFGVARTLEKISSGLSKKGTYTYMAPEVYQGEEDYDSSVDIYSLGIVMYKLLNNNFEPFRTQLTEADETEAFKSRMKNEQMPNPANASEDVAEVILKACSYYAKDRFASAHDMRVALEMIVAGNKPVITTKKELPPIDLDEDDDSTRGMFGEHEEKKENEIEPVVEKTKEVNRLLAMALAIFPYTSIFGVHDFYIGNKKRAKCKLRTLNFCIFGWLYDAARVILGKYKNEDGTYL